jgi:SAM-dependent methyltransferase
VDRDEQLRRGSSFGAVAAAYAEHRPGYPQSAVRWCLQPALSRAPGTAPEPDVCRLRVLDLGAGTGKLTALLASLGADVTAVEPDPAMLAELRRLVPGVRALPGTAEAIPLPDGSVDAVLCGQAMHWFDMHRAVPEIARVLSGGGVLAGLWNCDDDRVDWVAGLQAVAKGASSASLSTRRAEAADFDLDEYGTAAFTRAERAEFGNGQRRTARSLLATIATHSKVLVMAPDERDRLLAGVRGYLAGRPETSDGEFTLPMITVALRAVRRAAALSPPGPGL